MSTAPKMRCVVIEYENGLTITYEGEALDQWAQQYTEGVIARAQLQTLTAQANALASPEEPTSGGQTSNIRSLRDEINKRRADSE